MELLRIAVVQIIISAKSTPAYVPFEVAVQSML
jgi:hypothetical protein